MYMICINWKECVMHELQFSHGSCFPLLYAVTLPSLMSKQNIIFSIGPTVVRVSLLPVVNVVTVLGPRDHALCESNDSVSVVGLTNHSHLDTEVNNEWLHGQSGRGVCRVGSIKVSAFDSLANHFWLHGSVWKSSVTRGFNANGFSFRVPGTVTQMGHSTASLHIYTGRNLRVIVLDLQLSSKYVNHYLKR